MYWVRTIDRRSGYRSVHGETTKWVVEASDFIYTASANAMALEVKAIRNGGANGSPLLSAGIAFGMGVAL